MELKEKLSLIQNEMKVPKNQRNNFGNYNYRNAEDILETAKPICKEHKTTLVVFDEMVCIGERYYVKAIAKLLDWESDIEITATAYAREAESKKGMDDSQVTGSTSSYARKYALNGLFNIDDTKDSDFTNTHGKEDKAPKKEQPKSTKPSADYQPPSEEEMKQQGIEKGRAMLGHMLDKTPHKPTVLQKFLKAHKWESMKDVTFETNTEFKALQQEIKDLIQVEIKEVK